jgi:hypothetical protein
MADMTFSQSSDTTVEDAKAAVDARVKAAIDEGSRRSLLPEAERPRAEIAEPQGWWNVWAFGPFQFTVPGGPLLPNKIVKINETFSVAVVVWFSPIVLTPGGPSICNLITNLGCRIQLNYCTADLCRVTAATQFNRDNILIDLVPGQCFYTDVQTFRAAPGTESCVYEMNICARITGCSPTAAPQLAGFASAVFDFDPDLFYPPRAPFGTPFPGRPAGWRFGEGIRFMIYP